MYRKDIIILLGNDVHELFPKDIPSKKLIKIPHPSSIWSKQAQEKYVKDVLTEIKKVG